MLLLISGLVCFGQGGWKKKYYLQNCFTAKSDHIIETQSGDFIAIGITSDTLNNKVFNRLTLIGTDPNGNFLWRKDYGGPNFIYLQNPYARRSALYKDGNAFYLVAIVQDTSVREIGVLIKFNYNGDTIWQKIYRDPIEDVIPQALVKSVDNGFFITGEFQNWTTNVLPCMLIKTDINGNELWRKKIHKAVPDVVFCQAIVQDSLTKKIVITGSQQITNSTTNIYSNVLILDSLGNKKLQTTFNNADGEGFGDIIQLSDKSFLACGAWNEFYASVNFLIGFVVKFDLNGSIIWSKKYFQPSPDNQISFMEELENGDIMFLGTLDTMEIHTEPEQLKLILFKTDKYGNLKSKKYIGSAFSQQTSEYPSSFAKTQNNGFVISSWFPWGNNPEPYSIIKVDSTGCDTSMQWCQSVALGISNISQLTGYNFELFPNPATDFVNFKIDAPQDKKFVIEVMDVAGRIIDEGNIETNANLELNTNAYKAGVYFVKIFYEGRSVETKKFVVAR